MKNIFVELGAPLVLVSAACLASACAAPVGSSDASDLGAAPTVTVHVEAAPTATAHATSAAPTETTPGTTSRDPSHVQVRTFDGERQLVQVEAAPAGPIAPGAADERHEDLILSFYLPCGSWANPGQQVECGTTFFGPTDLYVFDGSTRVGGVQFQGIDFFVPAALHYDGEIDVSGWFWGAKVVFTNVGTVPLFITH
jgi:hypothetical protein